MKKGGRVFYGWFIVAACFLIMSVSIGILNNATGVYVKPVCEDMGFSRQQMALNNTLVAACQMAVALCAGRIYGRFDLKNVMRVSGIVLALGYASYSVAQNLWMFYLSSLVCGLAQGLLVAVSVSMLVSNWFHARRGTAMGIASMGSGVGGMICNPLAAQLILAFGWRHTYQILACVIFVLVVPACFFIIRTRPEEKGLRPYGQTEEETIVQRETQGMTARQARRTPTYWVLCVCGANNGISAVSLMHNVAPHLNDNGYSALFSSAVVSACMASLAIGKALLGYLFDKLGPRRATTLANCCSILALIGMVLVPLSPAIGLIVAGCGIGGAFGAVGTPILTLNLFGGREYGAILGMFTAFSNLGSMVGPLLVSGTYDRLGRYDPAFLAVAVLMACALLAYRRVLPKGEGVPEKQKEKEEVPLQ